MKITTKNFFKEYIVNPLSKELSYNERIAALALSILVFIPTLGITHAVCYYLREKRITIEKNKQLLYERNESAFQRAVKKTDTIFKATFPESISPLFNKETLKELRSEAMNIYKTPFPEKKDAKIFIDGKKVKWSSLCRSKKVEVLKKYGKVDSSFTKAFPNLPFYGTTTKEYLKNDPRETHGCDHAARTEIFSTIFAYLYQKYQPESNLTQKELTLLRLASAFHDSGRETDGVDLWEEKSAENARKALRKKGVPEEDIETVVNLILNREEGGILAKCLHDADSAEYARLLLTKSPIQNEEDFEASMKIYLSIYQDLKDCNGFVEELNALRMEMNQLIFKTHKYQKRKELASEENYFEALLNRVTPIAFPSLHYVLTNIGVKEKKSLATPENQSQPHSPLTSNVNTIHTILKTLDSPAKTWKKQELLDEMIQTPVWKDHVNYDPKLALGDRSELNRFAGGNFVRKRRVHYKKTEAGYQISFELTKRARERWEKRKIFKKRKKVSATYWNQNKENQVKIGENMRFSFPHLGVTIQIGCTKEYMNQYHLVQVDTTENTTPENLHKALCLAGMPEALLPSTEQEKLTEAKNRMETLGDRFKEDEISYQKDGELINPTLPLKAHQAGGRAFMTFVGEGSEMKETAAIVASIAKKGLLSSQERCREGIIGKGCNPLKNNKAGSANQVFTRLLTKGHFDKKVPLNDFAVNGKVMVLLNLDLFKKIPYTYLSDKSGVRNPDYTSHLHVTQNQAPETHFDGEKEISNRPKFHEIFEKLKDGKNLLTETMFDWKISPNYIQRLVVRNESDKNILMDELAQKGVEEINGIALKKLIYTSNQLEEEMLESA